MALTTDQKASRLIKKSFGAGETITTRQFFEEPKLGKENIIPSQIWTDADMIPTTAPILADQQIQGVVQYFNKLSLSFIPGSVSGSSDASYYHANLRDAIPFNYDPAGSYWYTLYKSDGTTVIAFGIGDWLVDTSAGVLTFYGSVPSGVASATPPQITFYKYVGDKGLAPSGATSGLNVKDPVLVATSTGDTLSNYDNATSGYTSIPIIIDNITSGGTFTEGVRILVKCFTGATALQNGIFQVSGTTLIRALDSDGTPIGEVGLNDYTFVTSGTSNIASSWVLNSTNAFNIDKIVVGQDTQLWGLFARSASYTTDNQAIKLDGQTFSLQLDTGGTYQSGLQQSISGLRLSDSLATIISTATSADTSLSTALSTEISERTSADLSLSTGLSTEISTRASDDISLSTSVVSVSSALSSEISVRDSRDLSLSTAVSTTSSSATSLSSVLSSEISTRDSGDISLSTSVVSVSSALSSEISVRTSSVTSLSAALSTEISTRASADLGLSSSISTEISIRTSSVTSLSIDLSTEISVRTSETTSLSTGLSTEISIRASADLSLSSSISTISLALSSEISTRGSDITSLSTALANFSGVTSASAGSGLTYLSGDTSLNVNVDDWTIRIINDKLFGAQQWIQQTTTANITGVTSGYTGLALTYDSVTPVSAYVNGIEYLVNPLTYPATNYPFFYNAYPPIAGTQIWFDPVTAGFTVNSGIDMVVIKYLIVEDLIQ